MSNITKKGIILAIGAGSRLHSPTISVSKQLMNAYGQYLLKLLDAKAY